MKAFIKCLKGCEVNSTSAGKRRKQVNTQMPLQELKYRVMNKTRSNPTGTKAAEQKRLYKRQIKLGPVFIRQEIPLSEDSSSVGLLLPGLTPCPGWKTLIGPSTQNYEPFDVYSSMQRTHQLIVLIIRGGKWANDRQVFSCSLVSASTRQARP